MRLAVADFVVGLVLLASGVAAWERGRKSWIGPLLGLAGFTWFLGTFAASGDSGYATFGALFVTLHRGPLVHALLSYPTGQVRRMSERAAIAVVYVLSAVADVGETAAAALVVAALVTAVAARRYLEAAGPDRRARLPAALAAVAFALVLLVSALTDLLGAGLSADHVVLWAYQVVVAGIAIVLAADLVLGRWVLATVTGLVVDLGKAAEAGTLRERLAHALGDGSLVLGYWLPERGVYVDERGSQVELPSSAGDRRITVVRDGGEDAAVLISDTAVVVDTELLESVAAAARIAVANARLHQAVRAQVLELEASRRRLVEAADAQRRRLESQLRDGTERRLEEVEAVLDEAGHDGNGGLAALLVEVKGELERARSELREFARGVHPRVLTEGGLLAALPDLVQRCGVPVEVRVPCERFSAPVEAAAYFVCAEGLTNMGKYAEASQGAIEIVRRGEELVVTVSDDGRGCASLEGGSGLRGLADRVEALGGRLSVTSPGGKGTHLAAELPLT